MDGMGDHAIRVRSERYERERDSAISDCRKKGIARARSSSRVHRKRLISRAHHLPDWISWMDSDGDVALIERQR